MAPSHGEPTEGVSQDLVVVLCTAPATQSETLARTLVEERLCACVNVVPAVRSFFRWEGKVDVADEDDPPIYLHDVHEMFADVEDARR